jgi:hypothetical protein
MIGRVENTGFLKLSSASERSSAEKVAAEAAIASAHSRARLTFRHVSPHHTGRPPIPATHTHRKTAASCGRDDT